MTDLLAVRAEARRAARNELVAAVIGVANLGHLDTTSLLIAVSTVAGIPLSQLEPLVGEPRDVVLARVTALAKDPA